MPFDESEPTRSLDEETGLLMDIDEVREAAGRLVDLVKLLAKLPMFDLFITMSLPEGMRFDIAVMVASWQSMFIPTSQADSLRTTGVLLGVDPVAVEVLIRDNNLSETLPMSHPNTPDPFQAILDPNDPHVKASIVLSAIAKDQAKPKEMVDLPESIQKFLDELKSKEYGDDAGN
jgi:hypothetical protein